MKQEPAILDVLFPRVRAEILRLLFGKSKNQQYVRELTRSSGVRLSTVQDELRKLSAIGLLSSYSDGYHRFYVANGAHPLAPELFRIVSLSERLPRTKGSALARKRGVSRRKKRHRPKPQRMRSDQPMNWGLFSRRPKT